MSRILVVEDHEPTRLRLTQVLRGWGHEVYSVATVFEAKQVLDQFPIDLLISDIDLPDGSGWELGRIARLCTRCPAIAMSGASTDDDVRMSLGAGFCVHLSKPLSAQPFADAVTDALQGAS